MPIAQPFDFDLADQVGRFVNGYLFEGEVSARRLRRGFNAYVAINPERELRLPFKEFIRCLKVQGFVLSPTTRWGGHDYTVRRRKQDRSANVSPSSAPLKFYEWKHFDRNDRKKIRSEIEQHVRDQGSNVPLYQLQRWLSRRFSTYMTNGVIQTGVPVRLKRAEIKKIIEKYIPDLRVTNQIENHEWFGKSSQQAAVVYFDPERLTAQACVWARKQELPQTAANFKLLVEIELLDNVSLSWSQWPLVCARLGLERYHEYGYSWVRLAL